MARERVLLTDSHGANKRTLKWNVPSPTLDHSLLVLYPDSHLYLDLVLGVPSTAYGNV